MDRLDQSYLINIVRRAKSGSSNAFAEVYTATSERHYSYLLFTMNKEADPDVAHKEIYVRILNGLSYLHNEALFIPWSLHIIYRYCLEVQGKDADVQVNTPAGAVSISRLMSIPVTESQAAIMRYAQHMSIGDIAALMNIDRSTVKLALRSALKHLQKGNMADASTSGTVQIIDKHLKSRRPDSEKVHELLESVFEECGMKPNSIPLVALSAYAVYRKERFSIQRGILIAAIVIFVLLPVLFLLPDYEVSSIAQGERGLPVYTVDIKSVMPAGKVTASINSHSLPVYEAAAREFTVEPTRNGNLIIEVELVNRQSLVTEYSVTDVDTKGPELTGSNITDGEVRLYLSDSGIGVAWRKIYAKGADGRLHYPQDINAENGEVVFEYPDDDWDVYIPDHIGNTLHLAFNLE